MTTTTSSSVNYVYSSLGYGIDGWANFGKSVRLATRNGAFYPPFADGKILNTSKLLNYYAV